MNDPDGRSSGCSIGAMRRRRERVDAENDAADDVGGCHEGDWPADADRIPSIPPPGELVESEPKGGIERRHLVDGLQVRRDAQTLLSESDGHRPGSLAPGAQCRENRAAAVERKVPTVGIACAHEVDHAWVA